jgi:hypothetical protein
VKQFMPLAALGAALAVAIATASCGEVPTLANGIAFITPVILPSPAVAANDTLRDSTGRVAPLGVIAIGQSGDTIRDAKTSFIVTSPLPPLVKVDASGIVVASDTVATVQIVARVGDRLQTMPASLAIVPQPDAFRQGFTADTVRFDTSTVLLSKPLGVTLSSTVRGTSVQVPNIVVRYRITGIFPADEGDTLVALVDEQSPPRMLAAKGRTANDTTDASGAASRRVRILTANVDSVTVSADVRNLRGVPLPGSPARFVVYRQ